MSKPLRKREWSKEEVEKILENVVGVAEAAEILGIGARQVRLLAQRGQLPGKKIGHDYAFWKPHLSEYKKIPRPRGRRPKPDY